MRTFWGWGLVLSLGLAVPSLGNELVLQFDYPKGVQVDSFLVTYHVSTDPGEQMRGFRIANAAAPVCPAKTAATEGSETRCTRPPACDPSAKRADDVLGPGVYSFRIQAERGTSTSDGSNWATCEAQADCRWDCASRAAVNQALLDATSDTPPQAPPSSPPMPPVATADREALAQQWGALDQQIPLALTTPIVAQPPV